MTANRRKTEGYSLRFPDGLRERIKVVAEANGRSLNAEIVATLEREYPDAKEQLRAAIRVLDAEIDKAPSEKRPELRRIRDQLSVELWFEPPEDEK